MSSDVAPDYKAARAFCDNLAAGAGLAWQPPELANLVRAFIALDEKPQNTPPAHGPIERISLSLERWAEGWAFVSVRILDKGQKHGLDERLSIRDIERGHVDLLEHVLASCLAKTARHVRDNWAVGQLLAYIRKGKL